MPMNEKYNSYRQNNAQLEYRTRCKVCIQPSKRTVKNIVNYARSIQYIHLKDVDIKVNLN